MQFGCHASCTLIWYHLFLGCNHTFVVLVFSIYLVSIHTFALFWQSHHSFTHLCNLGIILVVLSFTHTIFHASPITLILQYAPTWTFYLPSLHSIALFTIIGTSPHTMSLVNVTIRFIFLLSLINL